VKLRTGHGFCDHGNEPSGGEILDHLSNKPAFRLSGVSKAERKPMIKPTGLGYDAMTV
jgi:hypothetical protein